MGLHRRVRATARPQRVGECLLVRRVRLHIRRAKKDAELQSTEGGPREGKEDSVVTAETLHVNIERKCSKGSLSG